MNPINTIKQKTAVVQIDGGPGAAARSIEVHRMFWKPAKEFLRMLAEVYAGLANTIAGASDGRIEGLEAMLKQLPEIITQSDTLVTALVTRSTALTPEQLDQLDLLAASETIRTALEVNLDDELKNSFAGIVRTIAGLMPAQKPPTTS